MNPNDVGDRIRRQRQRLGLTGIALGKARGVTPETISRWEHGHILPAIEHAYLLAELFGMRVGLFMTADMADRLARVQAAIQSGTYVTPAKIAVTVERLATELEESQ